ncbi:ketol-acid reductoisomerase, partial [Candidatus Sulcia muelleri str. Hc (Homalodisca coagulata)]
GVQGPGQAQNLRDKGFKGIGGQRKNTKSWEKAQQEGWIENKTSSPIEEGVEKSTIIRF